MEDRIKEIFTKLGADLCGIANVERFANAPSGFHPQDIFADCKSVIVFAKHLPKGLTAVSPRIVYIKGRNLKYCDILGRYKRLYPGKNKVDTNAVFSAC